jgi:hypothetical protein
MSSRVTLALLGALSIVAAAQHRGAVALPPPPPAVNVEGQPLAANVERLQQTLAFLGHPLPERTTRELRAAATARDGRKLQTLLDQHVLLVVNLNPEARVKVARGPARAVLQQGGYTPVLVKVINESTVTQRLRLMSPQAGPTYAGVAELSMQRQAQPRLRENENTRGDRGRFLQAELYTSPPMTENLSGLGVEYLLALLYSTEAGTREATLGFELERGSQDLGFRGEVPVLLQVRPAIPVRVSVRDADGRPTVARLLIRDGSGQIYPSQIKRLAPDFFFQKQIYRASGSTVLLPPGKYRVQYSRGPEYRVLEKELDVPARGPARLDVALQRWVDPAGYGFYGGDHHIHAAGCAHYQSPTEGVTPQDMFLQVKGEGLNVGCVLTWGPCFEFQRRYFSPGADGVSEPLSLLKYDLEISGFGSQALGHVCLLNLKDQVYPGSDGTKTKGWPTWTTPVLRWARSQGAVTGYAHSASGLQVDAAAAAKRLISEHDADRSTRLSAAEAEPALLPDTFRDIDRNGDGGLSEAELVQSLDRAADRLPNLAIPEMNGVGAQEIAVTAAQGLCDFIGAMDSARIPEWNCWYHLLNAGMSVKVSGETDFPCMSSTRVGQGRVYVQLGKRERLDFAEWCAGIAAGRSYVSDGFAHALRFTVGGRSPGDTLDLPAPGPVRIRTRVAFAPEHPLGVAHGTVPAPAGPRVIGDTVQLHVGRSEAVQIGGTRSVELVVNGRPVASRDVPADGREHDLEWSVPVERSSWVALRQMPQLHTNPVTVRVAGAPIRASRRSALWCVEIIRQLWRARSRNIAEAEREEARSTFERAIEIYRRNASEAPTGS